MAPMKSSLIKSTEPNQSLAKTLWSLPNLYG